MKSVASVEAKLGPTNALLMAAQVNGQKVWLQLDTGSSVSTISQALASRLGIAVSTGPTSVYGIDGRALANLAQLDSLKLGNAASHRASFVVTPIGGDGADERPVGLFGSDYLRLYDVEIDLADGKVNLFSQDHCPGRVVYWSKDYLATPVSLTKDGTILLDATIDGTTVRAVLDTGSGETVLQESTARRRFDLTAETPGMVKAGDFYGIDGRPMPGYRYIFKTLALGGLTLHNPTIFIAPMTAPHLSMLGSHIPMSTEGDMLIGMPLIAKLRLYIAYGEDKLYYTVAAEGAGKS